MNIKQIAHSILITAVAISISACGGDNNKSESTLAGEIKIDGSSTVFPISEAMAEEFRAENPKVQVTIGVSGTGGGFKKFCRGEIDIAGASRPIKQKEVEACGALKFIEVPVAYDGLAVVVHKDNNWVDYFTVEELKKIWEPAAQGKIKKWNQIRPNWPDEEIHLYGAGTESGTFDYFTEAIMGESKASRGDYTASEDDNTLVQGVSGDRYGLAYFGLAYYEENQDKLKLVPIDDKNEENGKGAVLPSEKTVMDGTYQPLSRPLLFYINEKAANRKEVQEFVKYMTENKELVTDAKYIPLNESTYKLALERFNNKTYGSIFKSGESQVGLNIDEALKAGK